MVTLRLGRVVGPARRQLLAVSRRRCGLWSRLVPRAARARASPTADMFNDATLFGAICDTVGRQKMVFFDFLLFCATLFPNGCIVCMSVNR